MHRRRRRGTIAAVGLALVVAVAAPTPAEASASATAPAVQATPAAQAQCSLAPTPGTVVRTVSGRRYRLHVPAGLTAPAMLVVSLHGLSFIPGADSPADQESSSGWSLHADQEKYIIAYPEGSFPFGNDQRGWDYFSASGADLSFIRAVVANISSTYCVDPDRVHAEGHSMGGIMAQRLACEASDLFASVAGFAVNDVDTHWSPRTSTPCALERPTPVHLSCGALDPATQWGCAPARDAWDSRLSCPNPTIQNDAYGQRRTFSCTGGSELYWRKWTWQTHTYPLPSVHLDLLHDEIYDFFVRNPMT